MKQRHLFDWRFVMALTLAIAVAFIVYSGLRAQIEQVSERHASAERYAALEARYGQLVNELNHLQRITDENTRIFERNQVRMLDYSAAAARRQAAMLRFMRAHGLHIPLVFLRPLAVPHLTPIPVHSHGSTSGGTGSTTGSGGSTSGPHHTAAPQPGGSGGHRKKSFSGKGHRGHHGKKR